MLKSALMLPCYRLYYCSLLLEVFAKSYGLIPCAHTEIIPHFSDYFFFWNFQEGLARTEKRNRWDRKDRQTALDNLENFQEEAKTSRRGMWQYGDIQSDDEDTAPPPRKAAGGRK